MWAHRTDMVLPVSYVKQRVLSLSSCPKHHFIKCVQSGSKNINVEFKSAYLIMNEVKPPSDFSFLRNRDVTFGLRGRK